MLEKPIETKTKARARRQGFLAYKWSGVNRRGVPDDIFVNAHGHVFFIEFKATGKKPTTLQAERIGELLARGCDVFVVDSLETGVLILDLMAEVKPWKIYTTE